MSNNLTERLRAAFGRFQAQDLPGAERMVGEILKEAPGEPNALHLLGVMRLAGGNARESASLITRALAASPRDAAMLENLGLARATLGEYGAAESAFRQALEQGARHGLLHVRLGLALASQGRLPEAEAVLREAAVRFPNDPDVLLNLGNALAGQGHAEEALACYQKLLKLQPGHAIVHFNLGNLYRNMARWEEAAAAFEQALALAPNDADTHNNLGLVHEQQQRYDAAEACYRRALALAPGHVQAASNLGNALRAQGRLDEAVICHEQALAGDPNYLDGYINLGNARIEQGRYAEAKALYERVLRVDPRNFEAHFNLGMAHRIQGETSEAIACYRLALEDDPGRAIAHVALAGVYRETGNLEAAAAGYRRALEIAPGDAATHHELAETFKLGGRLDEAIARYESALKLKPDYFKALNGLVHLRQHICDWAGIEELWQRLRRDLAARADVSAAPFTFLSMPTSAEEQLASARAWAQRELAASAAARSRLGFDFSAPRERSRVRIGYLSWGFHRHATAHLAAELFELHDRGRFEIYAYACGPDDGSAIRARIRGACEHFVDVAGDAYAATARRIYDDGIDVLIDLTGYTLGARTQVFALRPAPVQVNWLGYPGTMGTECIDWIIADPYVIPEGQERHYAEKVFRLPHCYQINDRKREVSSRVPTRAECGLPEQGFVFCCFNQAYKLLPETFSLWMRVLRAVPQSVLWLAEANRWAAGKLRQAAADAAVAPERLVFAPRKPLPEYLAAYRLADLALDTFPYTSHTTASDALWMGCPLVTRVGETFASRVAGSILTSAGLAQCISSTPEDYERSIIELASSADRLATLRRAVDAARDASPLFDSARFVRDLEAAYERMVAEARNGRAA